MTSIKHIHDLDEYIEAIKKPSVVKFTGVWCGPCKRIGPLYEKLAKAYSSQLNFIEIDIDIADEIAEYESVQGIPLFLFYYKDEKIDGLSFSGYDPKSLENNVRLFSSMIETTFFEADNLEEETLEAVNVDVSKSSDSNLSPENEKGVVVSPENEL